MTDKQDHAVWRMPDHDFIRAVGEHASAVAELDAARKRIAALEAERDEAERTLLAVCRVVQLSPEAARHLAEHPPMITPEEMAWAQSVAAHINMRVTEDETP